MIKEESREYQESEKSTSKSGVEISKIQLDFGKKSNWPCFIAYANPYEYIILKEVTGGQIITKNGPLEDFKLKNSKFLKT